MESMAQRIAALRAERGLSRPALAAALGFGKNAVEKFETGRQTPTKQQQEQMAGYFGVSVFYLRGESADRTRQDTWLEGGVPDDAPGHVPAPAPERPKKQSAPAEGQSTLLDALLSDRRFQAALQAAAQEALRSPEGQALLEKAVQRELRRQK